MTIKRGLDISKWFTKPKCQVGVRVDMNELIKRNRDMVDQMKKENDKKHPFIQQWVRLHRPFLHHSPDRVLIHCSRNPLNLSFGDSIFEKLYKNEIKVPSVRLIDDLKDLHVHDFQSEHLKAVGEAFKKEARRVNICIAIEERISMKREALTESVDNLVKKFVLIIFFYRYCNFLKFHLKIATR